MAKVIKKQSALKEDYLNQKNKSRKAALAACVFVLTAVLGNVFMRGDTLYYVGLIIICVSAIGFIICCAYASIKQNIIASLKQGVDGEDITADILKAGLSDKYTVFQNSVITFEGKKSELDLIVVGENGIFVIETKNRLGRIVGGYKKEKWTQYKVGAKGNEYSADFYSPVKQVSTHVFRLAGYLRQNSAPAFINGIVYFAGENTQLEISGETDKIPVIKGEKNLIKFIKKSGNSIPSETCLKICEILKK